MKFLTSALLLAAVAACIVSAANPTVTTKYGSVSGLYNEVENGIYTFKGIPYAQPPIGSLRFADPKEPSVWSGVRNASEFSAGCMADCSPLAFPRPDIMCTPTMSEDCLYLNVFTPTLNTTARLPVVLFFHGGNFIGGAGGVVLYDGSNLAMNQGVVVVTINYRLGIFGGLYSGVIKGNFQLKDQRMSLKWIRDCIEHFGGDPHLVTITGQSAGASSVAAHMASPRSWGLFHRAISMSDPLGLMCTTPEIAMAISTKVLKNVSCPASGSQLEVECLRKLDAKVLLAAQSNKDLLPALIQTALMIMMPWTPVVDGDELPLQPITAFTTNNYNPVPFMASTVANESVQFVYDISKQPLSKIGLELLLEFVLANQSLYNNVIQEYGPIPSIPDERMFFSPAVTDMLFYCAWRAAGRAAAMQTAVFEYVFDFLGSWNEWVFGKTMPWCVKEVCHAQDIPFIFNPFEAIKKAGFPTPAKPPLLEHDLSLQMQQAWSNFARSGNPNVPNPLNVAIPHFGASSKMVNFSIPSSVITNYRSQECDFWDAQGYHRF